MANQVDSEAGKLAQTNGSTQDVRVLGGAGNKDIVPHTATASGRLDSGPRDALARKIDFAQEDAFCFDGQRCGRIVARVLQALSDPQPV